MATYNREFLISRYPGRNDEEMAAAIAGEDGYIAVVAYRMSDDGDFSHFGCCRNRAEIEEYLALPFDTKLIWQEGR